ncbi:hypothetical protein Ancab_002448 [Ancistrocladus abbreviatus]
MDVEGICLDYWPQIILGTEAGEAGQEVQVYHEVLSVAVEKRPTSSSHSQSESKSRSRDASALRSSQDSRAKRASKDRSKSRSSSGSPPGKKGLVSYGDGSPDSGQR